MNLIAIDTTSELGSIALWREQDLLEEVTLRFPEGFSAVLFGEIEVLLKRHALGLAQVNAFASASGPGSFTGVRVGLTAAKGLAEALGKPAFGVSNLQALASFGTCEMRGTLIDARRGEIYGAIYDSALSQVRLETVAKFSDWGAGLPTQGFEILSRDFAVPDDLGYRVTMIPQPLAAAVGRIAMGRIRSGEISLPEQLDANYVRRSDAELFWRDTA